ncbi:hypothetical protein RhiirA4_468818 [Rhizophagus irregularis]|uniref:Uncharacterized protein n=1 Tax=Rhizophagus irregularis TaxID=588596 RepID=A0A2I1GYF1_9GLOM|nr:hypothetical protein RhiirA4_468818 [Rhizophagus irregularis]
MKQFENTWVVLCTGHCLRVYPASHSADQRAIYHAHVTLLAGLPHGSVAADLAKIAEEVSAKSANIPSLIIHTILSRLTWHEPNEVSSLCHRCGRPGCNPEKCAFNDKLRELYNKHLPPSHPAKHHNCFTRPANFQQRFYHNSCHRPQRPSQAELDHNIAAMDDANDSADSRRLSDNLMDFSSLVSPQNGPSLMAQSHLPLSSRFNLASQLISASTSQDRLSSLTATVTELTKTVKQGIAQQYQFLAARDNMNNH